MYRSEITVDLAALRRNVATLLHALAGSELWAVVKADAYGHGAADAAGAALSAGASALCVATVPEGLALRREHTTARIVVMGPATNREVGQAREARLELVVSSDAVPPGYRHIDYDVRIKGNGTPEQFEEIHETVMATSPNYFNMSRPVKMNGRLVVG